jgi:hypothetical protein
MAAVVEKKKARTWPALLPARNRQGRSLDNPGSVLVMSLKMTIAAKSTRNTNAA